MKSSKITSSNPFVTSINQRYVRAQDYNNLKDDFDTLRTAMGFDTTLANVTINNMVTSVVNVSSAEILALAGSPKVLVAAPGAGSVLHFVSAILVFNSTATAYANGTPIAVYFSGGAAQSSDLAASFLTAGDKIWNMERLNATLGLTHPVNTALVLKASGAEFITGTGVLTVYITYSVITHGL